MGKTDSTQAAIRRFIEDNGSATGPELAEYLGITRQAVHLHLRRLIAAREIYKTGSTRAARYFPDSAATKVQRIKREFTLAGLNEATVYENLAVTLNLSQLPENVESIVHYAFTELLNNAIDHSMSDQCTVETRLDAKTVQFSIRDTGIGAFHSIAEKLNFEDEHIAMVELIKGKTTTLPDAHSGEGLFFVSKAADLFTLRSHRLQIEWNRDRDDVFVSEPRFIEGTSVQFEIGTNVRTRLEDVFAEFAPEKYDFRFEKTRVLVKLLQRDYVSRSEAKRLLHNLDKFSEIELDMRDVTHVGQGFTDEVFRVFVTKHPEIIIRATNAGKAVRTMIQHVGNKPA